VRNAFIRCLMDVAENDPRVTLVTGDLGFGVLDEFESRFPRQYLNAGVAEQNMTAVATGMALEGYVVFTYSIGNFPTLRCLEQLRNDTFYHDASVKVVSVGGGFSYGQLGMSHHATEDLSIMRALPGVMICVPGSAYEASVLVQELIARPGPAYLRLERSAPDFADTAPPLCEFGKARRLREGSDCTLIASGGIVSEVLAAADIMKQGGTSCRVLSMHTLKPFDVAAVAAAASETGGIVTIEENSINGGLGGAVAEVCLEFDARPRRFRRLGIRDRFTSIVGDQSFLRREVGIDRDSVAKAVLDLLR